MAARILTFTVEAGGSRYTMAPLTQDQFLRIFGRRNLGALDLQENMAMLLEAWAQSVVNAGGNITAEELESTLDMHGFIEMRTAVTAALTDLALRSGKSVPTKLDEVYEEVSRWPMSVN